jgi:hypothetical protein
VRFDVSDYLIWITAALAGWVIRHARSVWEWRRVRKLALADVRERGLDAVSPGEAVEGALASVQGKRVRRETIKVSRLLNGTGPHRKVGP